MSLIGSCFTACVRAALHGTALVVTSVNAVGERGEALGALDEGGRLEPYVPNVPKGVIVS